MRMRPLSAPAHSRSTHLGCRAAPHKHSPSARASPACAVDLSIGTTTSSPDGTPSVSASKTPYDSSLTSSRNSSRRSSTLLWNWMPENTGEARWVESTIGASTTAASTSAALANLTVGGHCSACTSWIANACCWPNPRAPPGVERHGIEGRHQRRVTRQAPLPPGAGGRAVQVANRLGLIGRMAGGFDPGVTPPGGLRVLVADHVADHRAVANAAIPDAVSSSRIAATWDRASARCS